MDYLIQINRHTLLEFGPVVDQVCIVRLCASAVQYTNQMFNKNCLQANLNFYRYNVNTYLFTFSVEIFQDSIKLMSLNLIKNNPLF